jgi:hypothetical protein
MTENELIKTELAFSLLRLLPPMLRSSVLEDNDFRQNYGLTVKANIRLNRSGATFDRQVLHGAARDLLGGKTDTQTISAVDKSQWNISRGQDPSSLLIGQGEERFPLPDFSCLSPDTKQRLDWLEQEAKRFDIEEEVVNRWRNVLAERPCDDEEVEQLRNEFRMTPRWFAGALISELRNPSVSIASLVPADLRYYERLVGKASEVELSTYIETVTAPYLANFIAKHGIERVRHALLLSSHSFIPKTISLVGISEKEMLELFEWLEAHGDRMSQLGAVELGLAHLDEFPKLEPVITKMINTLVADSIEDDGRLATLSGLIVLTEGEIARTGVLRNQCPFWRRLATFAHASLLERQMCVHGIPANELATWGIENRGTLFGLQTYVDLRREPRWLPDFLSAAQLKSEFVGRISGVAIQNEQKIKSAELRSLALEEGGPLQSLIVFPYPFLPGPLEGGVESITGRDRARAAGKP